MIATKYMKGLLATALVVTMAVTPSVYAAAAEATVTSGSSTYIFEEMPIAAFEVTGLGVDPYAYEKFDAVSLTPAANTFILWCIPYGSDVYSAPGSNGAWVSNLYNVGYANADNGQEYSYLEMNTLYTDSYATNEYNQSEYGFGGHSQEYIEFTELFHVGESPKDTIYVIDPWEDQDITWIPAIFGQLGATAVPISVTDALAKSNGVSVQSDATVETAQETVQATAETAQIQVTQPQITTTPGIYVVEPNDNLSQIAQKVYGDRKAWKDIYNANSDVIKNDYIIYKGQVLTIPTR